MTEKEKMLSGEPYCSLDSELSALRMRARKLCREYNDSWPDEDERRNEILRTLMGVDGAVSFGLCEPIMFEYGYFTKIGQAVFINHNSYFMDNGGITIGDYTMVGPNCAFYTGAHPLDAESRVYALPSGKPKWEKALPISIGKRCWIGGSVVVLPGITIGDDVVIGAGSVVTKDIPSGVVAAGNPCRVLKKIE